MHIQRSLAAIATLALAMHVCSAARADEYEVGGPLAGLKLPPYPTQHGEAPGYPGSIPELAAKGKKVVDMGIEYGDYTPQGQAPERLLYDGSVEHWRAYMGKYMPIRSSFDRQSQLKNWVAPSIPGEGVDKVEQYAEPVYWVPRHAEVKDTGYRNKPVSVIRAIPGKTRFNLDLGELNEGLYTVRVIGAVETALLRPVRRAVIVGMTVNDGLKGETSTHLYRCGYNDEFYSVAELYFHAPEKRAYRATLWLDQASEVELLVHNVTLDDTLAGTTRQAIKTRATLGPSIKPSKPSAMSAEDRLQRDADIWKAFPRNNAQGGGYEFQQAHPHITLPTQVTRGDAERPLKEIEEEFGTWKSGKGDVWIENTKLKLTYTLDDLANHRPLPDPYPYKDNGTGVVFPLEDGNKGRVMYPIAEETRQRIRNWPGRWNENALRRTDEDSLRDAAMAMIRWAYGFPTIDSARYLCVVVRSPAAYGRDWAARRRVSEAMYFEHYASYNKILEGYDALFDYINNSQDLANSVGRFVPWVKTPRDVIRLLDVYWLQTTAKRVMRYQYHTGPAVIADLATIAGDSAFTDPWMQWLFSRTFIYPLPPSGIQDTMITGSGREGQQFIGSTFYAQGEGADRVTRALDKYLAASGNPRWDLSDAQRYPKPAAHTYWRIDNVVAGADFLRIGDVTGPDKAVRYTLLNLEYARDGWKWTGDPRFAWIVANRLKQESETDEQWNAIKQAATTVKRAPWLDNKSRVLPTWASILETGLEHDDVAKRRAAYMRIGFGYGHHHDDTFDLQVVAHGLPMTVDGGQRPGYATPADRATRVHNTVEVDGGSSHGHSWATALADHPGVRYTSADSDNATSAKTELFRRAIALIDVDDDTDAPKSYVFDVFRVKGGQSHTYGFHGPISDDFQWNASNAGPPAAESEDAAYLSPFKRQQESHAVGNAPETLVATWQYSIDNKGIGRGERSMHPEIFDPSGPRKYTRLHLLGVEGARAFKADAVCHKWNYDLTQLMVRRQGAAPLASQFVGIVEPYAGEPFIQSTARLTVDGDNAVAAKIVPSTDRADVLFQDGSPDRARTITGEKISVNGEFAFHSTDASGLRQVVLVGGTTLRSPLITLEASTAARTGKVVKVDYLTKSIWIDTPWTARKTASLLEVGTPGHMTSYTADAIEADDKTTRIQLRRGADFLRSTVVEVNKDTGTVNVAVRPILANVNGYRRNWVASDDNMTVFWRADYLGEASFRLKGGHLDENSFGEAGVLRLWEYGVGDELRQTTSVSLRRIAADVFEVSADVDATIAMPGKSIATSPDGKSWGKASSEPVVVKAVDATDGPVYLKVSR